jgi:DNA invertase Pin-like site-specific DNA recombinase
MRTNRNPEQIRSEFDGKRRTRANSEFAHAGPQRSDSTTMRFAFYGRVSTDDAQDPSLSIPRQLGACEHAIRPSAGEVVAHYWDIESGRKDLAQRGNGADPTGFGVPVPRDGGLGELLLSAANGRPFEAVIVESIDRLSRMTRRNTDRA